MTIVPTPWEAHTWSVPGRFCSKLVSLDDTLVEFRPILEDSGPILVKFGPMLVEIGKFRSIQGQSWPNLDARFRIFVAEIGPKSVDSGPKLALDSANVGRVRAFFVVFPSVCGRAAAAIVRGPLRCGASAFLIMFFSTTAPAPCTLRARGRTCVPHGPPTATTAPLPHPPTRGRWPRARAPSPVSPSCGRNCAARPGPTS